jgi:selenide,water dikinase
MNPTDYPLTQFSHGAGCGCKISPAVLDRIISDDQQKSYFEHLLVGNDLKDDAAVIDTKDGKAIISTTDFFTPIVDDAYDFGAIAATNAISDIYAMGGKPLMAIAILGWPINKIPVEMAREVVKGGRSVCHQAGIPLAGGHSIDTEEPIFGLAVTGIVSKDNLLLNSAAKPKDALYLTKPLGVGLVTTARKNGVAQDEDLKVARDSMLKLNKLGERLHEVVGVHALTDVTGFGLLGHVIEMCEGSGCSAEIFASDLPKFDFVEKYLDLKSIPGGTERNWKSYGSKVELCNDSDYRLLADPQTSGGLLIACDVDSENHLLELANEMNTSISRIGHLTNTASKTVYVK